MPHGGQDGRTRLVGGQKPQALPARQLQIHREAVGQAPQLVDELHRGAGDGLGVDVAAKAVLLPQDAQSRYHELGGAVGASGDARGEEQPLDIVATVKADGEVGQLAGRKCGSGCLGVARAVHAVAAIVDADVGHEHLEQRDAAPVRRERMAASRLGGRAQLPGLARALNPGGGASYVVLRRIGQNLQLLDDVHRATPSRRQASSGPQLFTGTLVRPNECTLYYPNRCSRVNGLNIAGLLAAYAFWGRERSVAARGLRRRRLRCRRFAMAPAFTSQAPRAIPHGIPHRSPHGGRPRSDRHP